MVAALLLSGPALADLPEAAMSADVVILGERHNTQAHQSYQARAIAQLAPKAVVFEMLTPFEARRISALRAAGELRKAIADGEFHWTDFIDYLPLIEAAEAARIIGTAIPREDMRRAFGEGAAAEFGADADAYGLTRPLPDDEQEAREEAQFVNHCEAMPRDMMAGMVSAQRLRDAVFARTVAEAVETHGTPVVLVTGWGHARRDYGVPVYLSAARPDIGVYVVGLQEREPEDGLFDHVVVTAPEPGRDDPCAAFAARTE
ncbi:ChaN family lipoprotein [Pseudaestuariivita atlantica]|uniref:ChaN family lipoprotein n=1 Tax=Pseudaestuariivita atlantica TaxID=1317121 RepID=UPI00067D86BB|nr:ChaN family lipoprotein [Pseudaestuariivita atlantica]